MNGPGFDAFADQLAAASADLKAIANSFIAANDGVDKRADDRLMAPARATLTAWLAGAVRTCLHNPDPRFPQPVYSATYCPDLVVCAQCILLLMARTNAVEEFRCDQCGHQCTGEVEDMICPGLLQLAAFGWIVGVCVPCRDTLPALQ